MRVVTITKSYPTARNPASGCFIRERMAAVARGGVVGVTVLHAVPFGVGGEGGRESELPVIRVPYRYVPGVGKGLDHLFLAAALRPRLRRIEEREGIDLLDAHFGFPEGAAAVRLGRELGVPVVMTLRGTERRFFGKGARGRIMARAIRSADAVIAVSRSLGDLARRAGAACDRVRVIGNGVDAERFRPGDRAEARRRLGLPREGEVVLSVGALIERKGHHHLIRMFRRIDRERPGATLLVVGDGPWRARLRRRAEREGAAGRVRFAGLLDRDALVAAYRAADLLALASSFEGWANVLLEALACGVPVVATDVGAAREVVNGPELGVVVPPGDWQSFCDAILATLRRRRDPASIRRRALRRSWGRVAEEVRAVFREVLRGARPRRERRVAPAGTGPGGAS